MIVSLPGGESMKVATLGPGSVFGEMALIDLGTCTATIRASSRVDGWYVAHEDFRALVSQAQPAAIRLQHAVTVILAERVGALNAQLLGIAAPEDRAMRSAIPGEDPLAAVPRTRKAAFAAPSFLPRLQVFERCSADEIDELVAGAPWIELPRGHGVFAAGTRAAAAFVVVRGAVEIVAMREAFERRIAILGPGQLVGHLSVLRGRAALDARLRARGLDAAGAARGGVQRALLRRFARLLAPAPRGASEPARLDGTHQPRAHASHEPGQSRRRRTCARGARGRAHGADRDGITVIVVRR